MNRNRIMRIALVIAGLFNFLAALMFIFPDSLGRIAELPTSGSVFYNWLLALFIGLFGATYLWLSRQSKLDRPMVALVIIGKLGVFAVALACWLLAIIPVRGFAVAVGDLIFGLIFLWWLLGERAAERSA